MPPNKTAVIIEKSANVFCTTGVNCMSNIFRG